VSDPRLTALRGVPDNLLEELAQDQVNPCRVCKHLQSLSVEEGQEWDDAMMSPVSLVSTASLTRALARRNVNIQITSVGRHRRNHYGTR
jgi:hypothetical protein